MVSMAGVSFARAAIWIAQTQAERPLILRLEPEDRVRVLAALLTVLFLGLSLILFVWWGARATRRYMNSATQTRRRRQATTVREDDWATKPLYAGEDDAPREEE